MVGGLPIWRVAGLRRACRILKISGRIRSAKKPLKHFNTNVGYTTLRNAQASRGAERKVENAVTNAWSPVGDHNDYRSVRGKISNAKFRAEWQATMGGRPRVPIKRCTARCFS